MSVVGTVSELEEVVGPASVLELESEVEVGDAVLEGSFKDADAPCKGMRVTGDTVEVEDDELSNAGDADVDAAEVVLSVAEEGEGDDAGVVGFKKASELEEEVEAEAEELDVEDEVEADKSED